MGCVIGGDDRIWDGGVGGVLWWGLGVDGEDLV